MSFEHSNDEKNLGKGLYVKNELQKKEWITLKEASLLTGLKVQTLRMRIKAGSIEGIMEPKNRGYVWLVKSSSINKQKKLDKHVINFEGNALKLCREIIDEKSKRIEEQGGYISTLKELLANFQARLKIIEEEKSIIENKIKLLPAPPEEIIKHLQEKEKAVIAAVEASKKEEAIRERIQEEKKKLQDRVEEMEDKEKLLQARMEDLLKEKQEMEKRLRHEEELKNKAQFELKDYKSKPWWKKIFEK